MDGLPDHFRTPAFEAGLGKEFADMSSTVMMERGASGLAGLGMPGLGTGQPSTAGLAPTANMMMVPRCTIRIEKCTGGCKFVCSCEDKLAVSMMQNLCT